MNDVCIGGEGRILYANVVCLDICHMALGGLPSVATKIIQKIYVFRLDEMFAAIKAGDDIVCGSR